MKIPFLNINESVNPKTTKLTEAYEASNITDEQLDNLIDKLNDYVTSVGRRTSTGYGYEFKLPLYAANMKKMREIIKKELKLK